MPDESLKAKCIYRNLKHAVEEFLEENKDVQPGDSLFLLIIYAEGLRDAIKILESSRRINLEL